jgi:hypothetical protein
MRPNTPHYVVGVDNCITIGYHFYSTASIFDSILGIIHTTILGMQVTNQQHGESRTFLHRLMAMWVDHYQAESARYGKWDNSRSIVDQLNSLQPLLSNLPTHQMSGQLPVSLMS